MAARVRHAVTLGRHGDDYVFDLVQGLHDPDTGLAVVGTPPDPEVLFEEHGTGEVCRYLTIRQQVELNPELGPQEQRPDIAERVVDEDPRDEAARSNGRLGPRACRQRQRDVGHPPRAVRCAAGRTLVRGRGEATAVAEGPDQDVHSSQAQPDRPMEQMLEEPEPLEEHSAGADISYEHFYLPIVLLSSPSALGAVAHRIIRETSETYLLIIIFGYDQTIRLRDGDVEWADIYSLSSIYRNVDQADVGWLMGMNHPAACLPPDELLRWWTDQLNALLTEVTDLGRYRTETGLLDGRHAYPEIRTLDRIFINSAWIQAHPEDHVGRETLAFEFFDLLPRLIDQQVGARKVFETLINGAKAQSILEAAFAGAPPPIRDHLVARAQAVTDQLRDETLATVIPGRETDEGVLVGDKATDPIPSDEYVAKLYHQLRNTHHGYELDAQWKRDLLDSHTGHIAVGFPELAVLYTLAIAAEPDWALSAGWFDS